MVDGIYESDEAYKATERQLEELLEKAFNQGAEEMESRGFKRRVGFGTRPAVIHIDMANAWTRPGHPFTCRNMDTIIPACQDLNAAARAKGVPVIFITTHYDVLKMTGTPLARAAALKSWQAGMMVSMLRQVNAWPGRVQAFAISMWITAGRVPNPTRRLKPRLSISSEPWLNAFSSISSSWRSVSL